MLCVWFITNWKISSDQGTFTTFVYFISFRIRDTRIAESFLEYEALEPSLPDILNDSESDTEQSLFNYGMEIDGVALVSNAPGILNDPST